MSIVVAEAGLEPAISRLWASRAAAAPLCRMPAPRLQAGYCRWNAVWKERLWHRLSASPNTIVSGFIRHFRQIRFFAKIHCAFYADSFHRFPQWQTPPVANSGH